MRRNQLLALSVLLAIGVGCNKAPNAPDGLLALLLGSSFNGQLSATDANGDELTFEIVVDPAQGTLSLTNAQTGAFTYVPDPGQTDDVEFRFVASDGKATSQPAVVTISLEDLLAGSLTGLAPQAVGQVIASSPQGVAVADVDAAGAFHFDALPGGEYVVKAAFDGYSTGSAVQVNTLESHLTWESDVGGLAPDAATTVQFTATPLGTDPFVYHWEEDGSLGGAEYSSHVNTPISIEYLAEEVEIIDASAAQKLHHDYNIVLANDEQPWTQEHAYRLLETMSSIPQQTRFEYDEQSLPVSKWILTTGFVENDIEIEWTGADRTVRLAPTVFDHAAPRLAVVDGARGHFYSRRLHHALVRFATDEGNDLAAVEQILKERFSLTTVIPDYSALTALTTAEPAARFQSFHPWELIEIINQFEEMPAGMHRVEGLDYLVRRLDGTPHPLYGGAPAVAWTHAGYIEFMDSAFTSAAIDHTHRLMIHEKAHFLYEHLFSDELVAAWEEVGGWYLNPDDPDGWSTTLQTEFVSAYAHRHNPDEDMAETISYYVMNPDLLRSRSPGKFEFVHDRIMHSSIYIAEIREDLTFEVYNLAPDYVFPGKIRRVDVRVDGSAFEDKLVVVEIELHDLGEERGGAQSASMRILSEIGTYQDLWLYPVDGSSTVLRGSFSLSRFAKSGFWRPDQIKVWDAVGNQRFSGVDDFGWRLYVDNPLEDVVAPVYVSGTATVALAIDTLSYIHYDETVQIVSAEWEVDEAGLMRDNGPCYASLVDDGELSYARGAYGDFDDLSRKCRVEWVITQYHPSGEYAVNWVSMVDVARNIGIAYLTGLEGEDSAPTIQVVTANPDMEAPELDLNDISIVAEPTQPQAPNGETLVTIVYYARDDKSGLGMVRYSLRDPQGIEHGEWHYHENTYTIFFEGDATAWTRYEINTLLPEGSAPGQWGLSSLHLRDKAGNFESYDFVEIMHFDIEK